MVMRYNEQLQTIDWKKKRSEIYRRDKYTCQNCFIQNKVLCVHHRYYVRGNNAWEYPSDALLTLCLECHDNETKYRKLYEQDLLRSMSDKLLGEDIDELAYGFSKLKKMRSYRMVVRMISWLLKCDKKLDEMIKVYENEFNRLSKVEDMLNLLPKNDNIIQENMIDKIENV